MDFQDRPLQCLDCKNEFIFTAGEQEFYDRKGFKEIPKRCKPCRDQRKTRRGGSDSTGGGYGRRRRQRLRQRRRRQRQRLRQRGNGERHGNGGNGYANGDMSGGNRAPARRPRDVRRHLRRLRRSGARSLPPCSRAPRLLPRLLYFTARSRFRLRWRVLNGLAHQGTRRQADRESTRADHASHPDPGSRYSEPPAAITPATATVTRLKLHLVDRADFHKYYEAASGMFVPGNEPPNVGERVTVEVVFQGGPRVLLARGRLVAPHHRRRARATGRRHRRRRRRAGQGSLSHRLRARRAHRRARAPPAAGAAARRLLGAEGAARELHARPQRGGRVRAHRRDARPRRRDDAA